MGFLAGQSKHTYSSQEHLGIHHKQQIKQNWPIPMFEVTQPLGTCARVAAFEIQRRYTQLAINATSRYINRLCMHTDKLCRCGQTRKGGQTCLVLRLCAKPLEQSIPIQLVGHSVCHLATEVLRGREQPVYPDSRCFLETYTAQLWTGRVTAPEHACEVSRSCMGSDN